MGGGRAVEITSIVVLRSLLVLVVGVEGPGQLLRGIAHAVCSVHSRGSVGCDTIADTLDEAAHLGEETLYSCIVAVWLRHARKSG